MASRQGLLIRWEPLRAFTQEVFRRLGMSDADAAVMGELLTEANLRGTDSHSVHLIPRYIDLVKAGLMNPKPEVRVVKETPASIVVDADLAFGYTMSVWAMKKAMEKAKQVGIGYVLIRRSTHQGAMYYYPLMAAKQDMIGFAWTASQPSVAPYGANAPGIGSNPLAIAVPANRHWPLVLDMACSVVGNLKFAVAHQWGKSLPEGWAVDKDGNPTTDPLVGLQPTSATLPMGGPKGSGLSIVGEAMMSILVGMPFVAPALSGKLARTMGTTIQGSASMLYAIDIATFADVSQFKANVDDLIDQIKKVRRAPGVEEIYMPGEIEFRNRERRLREGIPFPPVVVQSLREVGHKLGVKAPF